MKPVPAIFHAIPLLLGIFIVIASFILFDPLWPAQDMPPDIAEKYYRDYEFSRYGYRLGLVFVALGVLWLTIRFWSLWKHAVPLLMGIAIIIAGLTFSSPFEDQQITDYLWQFALLLVAIGTLWLFIRFLPSFIRQMRKL